MFGRKSKEITRLMDELAAANTSLADMYAEYEEKLSNAKNDINARESTITSQKTEIANLRKSLEDSEKERKHLSSARDILASNLKDEGTARTKAESALQAARIGEDSETDAFYTAKFAYAKNEPESATIEDTTVEIREKTEETTEQVAQIVSVNTENKKRKDRHRR